MRTPLDWGVSKVTLHCVPIGKRDSTCVFAFCRGGTIRPFAMTGMRHILWNKVSSPSPVEMGTTIHQYKEDRKSMVEELVRQVSPRTSTLNHRQRFALQQSFIVQACTLHKGTVLGEMKRVLRSSSVEWYRRRVACTVNACKANGIDIGLDPGSANPVKEPDVTFILSTYQTTQTEVNPHWWLAACVE